MAAQWNVNRNDGERAALSYRFERITVERPEAVGTKEFCEILRPGTIVLDSVVKALSDWQASDAD